MKITEMTASTLSASVPAYDYDWYQANLHAVETFGLLNAFEDREARNRFRRIQKALNPVPAKIANLKKVSLADLPAGIEGCRVSMAEVAQLPKAVREVVEEVARLWAASGQPVAFPGVYYGVDDRGGKLTWWVNADGFQGENLETLPSMVAMNGRLCVKVKTQRPNGYLYRASSLKNVLQRLRRGAPVFGPSA